MLLTMFCVVVLFECDGLLMTVETEVFWNEVDVSYSGRLAWRVADEYLVIFGVPRNKRILSRLLVHL